MKKGFTLVELLVVVVVIVTLMAVAFRVSTRGLDANRRADTVAKLQKLENCLSGYYAAYGSYPPVPLHGSRDYTFRVNYCGIQKIDTDEHWDAGEMKSNWSSVEAACRSQPVAFECPFPLGQAVEIEGMTSGFFKTDFRSLGFDAPEWRSRNSSWTDLQLFKFGLLSFLLPRLVIMCNGCKSSDGLFKLLDNQRRWLENTDMPVNFDTGQPYGSWQEAARDMVDGNKRWKLLLQPSQSVCARWIENLSKCVTSSPMRANGSLVDSDTAWLLLYGVNIRDESQNCDVMRPKPGSTEHSLEDSFYYTFSAGGASQGNTGTKYILRYWTATDNFGPKRGWANNGTDFYYYSPPPHQTYVLWSAGKNTKTFPPWVSEDEFESMDDNDRKTAQEWMADDIVYMKN